MKIILSALFLVLVLVPLGFAQEPTAVLDLTSRDVRSVDIALEPKSPPKLRVYLSKSALEKLREILGAATESYTIRMNGETVATPRVKGPFEAKVKYLPLTVPDLETAAATARLFIPAP